MWVHGDHDERSRRGTRALQEDFFRSGAARLRNAGDEGFAVGPGNQVSAAGCAGGIRVNPRKKKFKNLVFSVSLCLCGEILSPPSIVNLTSIPDVSMTYVPFAALVAHSTPIFAVSLPSACTKVAASITSAWQTPRIETSRFHRGITIFNNAPDVERGKVLNLAAGQTKEQTETPKTGKAAQRKARAECISRLNMSRRP